MLDPESGMTAATTLNGFTMYENDLSVLKICVGQEGMSATPELLGMCPDLQYGSIVAWIDEYDTVTDSDFDLGALNIVNRWPNDRMMLITIGSRFRNSEMLEAMSSALIGGTEVTKLPAEDLQLSLAVLRALDALRIGDIWNHVLKGQEEPDGPERNSFVP